MERENHDRRADLYTKARVDMTPGGMRDLPSTHPVSRENKGTHTGAGYEPMPAWASAAAAFWSHGTPATRQVPKNLSIDLPKRQK